MTIQIAHSPSKYPATQRLPAVLPTRNARGGLVGACTPPNSFFVLWRLPSSIHACANIPAGTARCFCFPASRTAIDLPIPQVNWFTHSVLRGPLSADSRSGLNGRWNALAVLCHRSASGHVVTSMSHPDSCQPKSGNCWARFAPARSTHPS